MHSGLFRKELFDGWQPTLKAYRPTEEGSDLRNLLNSNKSAVGASVINFNKAVGGTNPEPTQPPQPPREPIPVNPWGLQPGQSPWQNQNIWQPGQNPTQFQYQNQFGWQANRGRGRGRGRGRTNSSRNFGPNY